MSLSEKVADVLREHRWADGFTSNCACGDETVWTFADHNAHVAELVVAALGLTEEWAVSERGIFGDWHKTRESAEKHCDTIRRNWDHNVAFQQAEPTRPDPQPVSRFVTWLDPITTGAPMSLFTYGPLVPYFAWRPVNTIDAGWVWLKRISRRRCYLAAHLTGPSGPWWDYWRYTTTSKLKRGLA